MVPSIGGVLEAECVDFSGMQRISSIEIDTAEVSAKEEMQVRLLRQRRSATACKRLRISSGK